MRELCRARHAQAREILTVRLAAVLELRIALIAMADGLFVMFVQVRGMGFVQIAEGAAFVLFVGETTMSEERLVARALLVNAAYVMEFHRIA
jgi:hypothetical protein